MFEGINVRNPFGNMTVDCKDVSLIVNSPTIEVFAHFNVVNMERPGSDLISENHSVLA